MNQSVNLKTIKSQKTNMKPTINVSVIIPTIAVKENGPLLRRATESIRHSSENPVRIIVVVNGGRADPEICEWLKSQSDIHYERVITPSAPLAIFRGRELVQTPFFSTLDDDDEYLMGGTDLKLSAFSAHPEADMVITSGFRQNGNVDEPAMTPIDQVPLTPLPSLFEFNWLSSCNALYRSASFPPSFFVDSHPYGEWTWLAFKLALAGKQLVAISQPTFRIHNTPGSLSKSAAYRGAYQALYRRMLALDPPNNIVLTIKKRMGSDWHDQSVRTLACGGKLRATGYHLRSLMLPGGLQYVAYTRRLIPLWPQP